jgi:hypothetical protein
VLEVNESVKFLYSFVKNQFAAQLKTRKFTSKLTLTLREVFALASNQIEMFYNSDFRTLPARFHPRFDNKTSFGSLKTSQMKTDVVPRSEKTLDKTVKNEITGNPKNILHKWFINFCENSSVHGLKYIGQIDL